MHERYFSIEQNNTGKSPQKCCSFIDEGMNKLTEDKAKTQGQGYLHNRDFLLTALEFETIILLLAVLLRLKCDSNCYPTKTGHTIKCRRLRL